MSKPVAISMGDPAGVGPELIDALIQQRPHDQLLIFGDYRELNSAMDHAVINDFNALSDRVNVFQENFTQKAEKGIGNIAHAPQIISNIKNAVNAVQSGAASALLTAPINKANLVAGGQFEFPGHTEFLAHLDKKDRAVMLLTAENILSVVPTTIHIPVKEIHDHLTPELLSETIKITSNDLERYLGHKPRIYVAGLNPHAGENGLMGFEEVNWINDCVKTLQTNGLNVEGPFSADTMFHAKARAKYDVAVCMYHDQALIPIKTLAFDQGVNVTLGLSFLRTSPDHGTAYDIAGKQIADPSSFIAAYDLAKKWGAARG